MDSSLAHTFIAAVGGTLVFVLLQEIKSHLAFRPRAIREPYWCANAMNRGTEDEAWGELMHHHGRRVDDPQRLRGLDTSRPCWEWTRDKCGTEEGGKCVIYGPYATDFTEPGLYSATFRIKATGLKNPEQIEQDLVLVWLDVYRSNWEYRPLEHPPEGEKRLKQEIIAIHYVTARELAKGGWRDYEVHFWSNAVGLWEYRVFVFDGASRKPDNIGRTEIGQDVHLYFDQIILKHYPRPK
ncbi:MAG: hypothetical protein AB1664_13890 [Thermodesulfobacteriota bacterium]